MRRLRYGVIELPGGPEIEPARLQQILVEPALGDKGDFRSRSTKAERAT